MAGPRIETRRTIYPLEQANEALESIQTAKRVSDDAARWGGDELAVLLDGGDEAAALRTTEVITRQLAAATMRDPSIVLTVRKSEG